MQFGDIVLGFTLRVNFRASVCVIGLWERFKNNCRKSLLDWGMKSWSAV